MVHHGSSDDVTVSQLRGLTAARVPDLKDAMSFSERELIAIRNLVLQMANPLLLPEARKPTSNSGIRCSRTV
jgi:hypothetical protein